MLYEDSDPFLLTEPGGVLDVTDARYEAVDARITRVTGSRWTEEPYTMKLEGAGGEAFQTIMIIGVRDPKVLAALDVFEERLLATLHARIATAVSSAAGEYDLSLRLYGWSGVTGHAPPAGTPPPVEVGVMLVITAATQALATRLAKTCNPQLFHFAMEKSQELPSYAYPFSPAEIERGQVFAFRLNHVARLRRRCRPHRARRPARHRRHRLRRRLHRKRPLLPRPRLSQGHLEMLPDLMGGTARRRAVLVDEALHGITEISEQMPTVGDLDSVRRAVPDPVDIGASPIPGDDLYARMLAQPRGDGCGFPIGQEIDDGVRLKIHHHRAIASAPLPGPVIDA